MCPKYLFIQHSQRATQYSQRGFLLPLALFILIVMGALALVISRTATQTHHSITQELLSLQSFYAAESGAQRGLQTLFFPDPGNRMMVDARCSAMNLNLTFSSVPGLQLCTAQVSCSCLYRDGSGCNPGNSSNYLTGASSAKASSYYNITSAGRCGQDQYLAVRTIEAGAHLDQGGP